MEEEGSIPWEDFDKDFEVLNDTEDNEPAAGDDEPMDIDDDHGMNPYDGTYEHDYPEDYFDS
jgi:hypothetical protein